jgi:hypothetical protein
MPAGCSLAQALCADRNAGRNGLGSAPLDPGSGKLRTPFARMQSAYLRACVPAVSERGGTEDEPQAATEMAQTASAGIRRGWNNARPTVRRRG